MPDPDPRLAEIADAIHSIARRLPPPVDPAFERCTPVEVAVMRFVHRHPGTSARAVSEAILLPSSNLSRTLRGLEARDLIRRDTDEHDARGVRLHPTEKAQANLRLLHDSWSRTLTDIIDDSAALDLVADTLRSIDDALLSRRPA